VIRCLDEASVWLPTVEGTSVEGPVIGLLTHPSELEPSGRRGDDEHPPSAPDVTALLRFVGHEMARRGRLVNPWTLYADAVRPEIWARTEELTDATSRYLECYLEDGEALELPLRHTAAGEVVAAVEAGVITVFLAGDDDALATVVGRHLTEGGHLRHPEDLRVAERRAAPAERLDPSEILTGRAEAGDIATVETKDQEVTKS
jgi:hypothetical protein